ncbi:polyprotein of retroviral origin, putative, partial [Ixodes scapularis]
LQLLQEYSFTMKREKCVCLQGKVEYLGQVVSANGFTPSTKKVSAILNMPEPKTISQLRSLLSMVQHYIKFLLHLAYKCTPLNKLLRKNAT